MERARATMMARAIIMIAKERATTKTIEMPMGMTSIMIMVMVMTEAMRLRKARKTETRIETRRNCGERMR